jgi:hypothetical protein
MVGEIVGKTFSCFFYLDFSLSDEESEENNEREAEHKMMAKKQNKWFMLVSPMLGNTLSSILLASKTVKEQWHKHDDLHIGAKSDEESEESNEREAERVVYANLPNARKDL